MAITTIPPEPKTWGVVELMGHRRIAGRITEEAKFGTALLRIDVPQPDDTFVTQYYGGQAIYCLTVTSEEAARVAAKTASDVSPVSKWDFPKMPVLAAAKLQDNPGDDRDESNGDDDDLDDDEDDPNFRAATARRMPDGSVRYGAGDLSTDDSRDPVLNGRGGY